MDPAMAVEAAALAKQKPMLDALAQGNSDVQRFYKNSVVFITGGSGFLGKQLLEKLLRCCQISKIYMLVRSKKGVGTRERIQEIIKDPVFDTLHSQQPTFHTRIIAVEGDVAKLQLGIKDGDWKILTEEVEVIFHVAATTRFDESLHTATLINVRGTREAILLARSCKKLRAHVHVSTAYSQATVNLIGSDIQETFYDAPVPSETMISMAESVEPDRLNSIARDLIKGWPNTYTFTKAIAEDLIRSTSDGLPICIVRPAIVLSTYGEPYPGWLDQSCIYGAAGLLLGGGLGALHTVYGNADVSIGFVPCDYVNNTIIAAARKTSINHTRGGSDTKIYTACSTNRNPITCGSAFCDLFSNVAKKYATPMSLYYIFVILTPSKFWFALISLYFHVIPAYIADVICNVVGKQARYVKLTKKLRDMNFIVSHFTLNEWNLIDNNWDNLFNDLTSQDKAIFNFDITNMDWDEYTRIIGIGLRKYIIKDGLKDTEYAVKKMKYLHIGHYFIMMLYIYCIFKVIFTTCSLVRFFFSYL